MKEDFDTELEAMYDKSKREAVTELVKETIQDIDNMNGRDEVIRLTLLSIMKISREKLALILDVKGRHTDDFFRIELLILRAILEKGRGLHLN